MTALRPEHFTGLLEKEVLRGQQCLRAKKMTANAITVFEYVKQQPLSDELKSFAQIVEIEDYPTVCDEPVLRSFERILIPPWRVHKLAAAHEKARLALEDDEDPDLVQRRFEKDVEPALHADAERPYLIRVNEFPTYFSPVEALIDRFLFRASKTMIFGPAGIGKTKIGVNDACEIAQHSNVVWVAAERADEVAEAVDGWKHHHKKDVPGFYLREEPVYLLQSESVARFIREVKKLEPAALFIDPWANCLAGGNESGTDDTIFAVEGLNRIVRETGGPATEIIHHTGWNDSHERGSYALRTGCKVVGKIALNDDTLLLSCEKSNTKPFETMRFRLVESLNSVVALPSSQAVPTDKLNPRQREVLVKLANLPVGEFNTLRDLAQVLKISKSSLSDVLFALRRRGLVEQRAYTVTTKGLTVSVDSCPESPTGQTPQNVPTGQAPDKHRTTSDKSHLSDRTNLIGPCPTGLPSLGSRTAAHPSEAAREGLRQAGDY
ncbi:MAG TPA: AAA family ATPase [Blastocatellia bacterium]|nr:AAA family ATPase [Blastocatellia bacterium]